MSHQALDRRTESVLDVVREAGELALEYFRRPVAIEDKRSHGLYDPVTEADRRVEELIRARLSELFPGHRIVGEEQGSSGEGDSYWLIDPIDGTRAFISGMPLWGILLALVEEGRPAIGIVHQPFTGETFVGAGDESVLLRGKERTRLRVREAATLEEAVLYSTHPEFIFGMEEGYEVLQRRCRLQRWGGDCYAYCMLALGFVDLVIEGMLMPYDIVPLIPIVEGAGGVVTDLEGGTPMAGGSVVASGNERLHREVLAILNREPSD